MGRFLKVTSFFGKKSSPKEVLFDNGDYKVIYEKSKKYGTKSTLICQKTRIRKTFEGSLRYIGEGFFINISFIRVANVNRAIELSETGEKIKTFTIVYFSNSKKLNEIDITKENLNFIFNNYYNKIYFKIENGYLSVYNIDINNDKMDRVIYKKVSKTKERYIEEIDPRKKTVKRVESFYGNMISKNGELDNKNTIYDADDET